jgi:hypothetical protein
MRIADFGLRITRLEAADNPQSAIRIPKLKTSIYAGSAAEKSMEARA